MMESLLLPLGRLKILILVSLLRLVRMLVPLKKIMSTIILLGIFFLVSRLKLTARRGTNMLVRFGVRLMKVLLVKRTRMVPWSLRVSFLSTPTMSMWSVLLAVVEFTEGNTANKSSIIPPSNSPFPRSKSAIGESQEKEVENNAPAPRRSDRIMKPAS